MSFLIFPAIKEAPLQGLSGLWGGVASNLTGGGGSRDATIFRGITGDADIENMTDYNGVSGFSEWVAGDLVECTYSGSQRTWYARGYNGAVRVYCVGGGGSSLGENGGWCSNSGGGGGAGLYGVMNCGGNNKNFTVGYGGQITPNPSNWQDRGSYTNGTASTWHQSTYGGGERGYWCKDPNYRGSGGSTGSETGFVSAAGSNGGTGGGAQSVGGGNPSEDGQSSNWGGGGGGGGDDNGTYPQRRGGQCASSITWTSTFYNTDLSAGVFPTGQNRPYAGAGAPKSSAATFFTTMVNSTSVTDGGYDGNIPTPNRGGGGGGCTSGDGSQRDGIDGSNGCIILEIIGE